MFNKSYRQKRREIRRSRRAAQRGALTLNAAVSTPHTSALVA